MLATRQKKSGKSYPPNGREAILLGYSTVRGISLKIYPVGDPKLRYAWGSAEMKGKKSPKKGFFPPREVKKSAYTHWENFRKKVTKKRALLRILEL